MAVKENKMIAKAKQEYEYLTGDAAVRRIAFLREKWESDRNSDIAWNRKQAKEEGRALGKREGKKEGKEEEKIEIAKEMLKKNMSKELIIEITKLTKEEIKEIEKQID